MEDQLSQSDEDIVALVQQGDKEKYGLLMRRYNEKLSRYGRKFLSDKENIEDIVQDVFIKTFQNINSFDTSLKFSSWVYRIAHNAFVNALKKQQNSPIFGLDLDIFVSHDAREDSEGKMDQEKMKKMIDLGLNQLKPKYKEAIILHFLEEFTYKEISDILQIPTGTVGIRVLRGKEALRKTYEKMNIKLNEDE